MFEPTKKWKQSQRAWLCPKCIFVGKKIVFSLVRSRDLFFKEDCFACHPYRIFLPGSWNKEQFIIRPRKRIFYLVIGIDSVWILKIKFWREPVQNLKKTSLPFAKLYKIVNQQRYSTSLQKYHLFLHFLVVFLNCN